MSRRPRATIARNPRSWGGFTAKAKVTISRASHERVIVTRPLDARFSSQPFRRFHEQAESSRWRSGILDRRFFAASRHARLQSACFLKIESRIATFREWHSEICIRAITRQIREGENTGRRVPGTAFRSPFLRTVQWQDTRGAWHSSTIAV